jgi:hypothetical protein
MTEKIFKKHLKGENYSNSEYHYSLVICPLCGKECSTLFNLKPYFPKKEEIK